MERISTGIAALDDIVGGGVPTGSLIVLAGPPGTGKTILAQQMAFANGRSDNPAFYYTTVSEPHAKLVRHLRAFDFFDESKLGHGVELLHLTDLFGPRDDPSSGVGLALMEIVRRAFDERPSVVVIDSSKALRDFEEPERLREAMFEFASKLAHTGTVLVLVGEYDEDEFEQLPEFAIADGIIYLANRAEGAADRRWLRVLKMRGSNYLMGQHTFRISTEGHEVFPRLETIAVTHAPEPDGRASFGVADVDDMTGGGLPLGDATLVMGPSGAGKTLLCCHLVDTSLTAGRRCLYVSLQETTGELLLKASSFGMRLHDGTEDGSLRILNVPPMELEIDQFAGQLRRSVAEFHPALVVVDGIGDIVTIARRANRYPSYLIALATVLREQGALTVFTYEVAALGAASIEALSYLFHDVILLRYMERSGELARVLTVLKMRHSGHAHDLLQYSISAGRGFTPGGRAGNVRHVLGWNVIGSPTGSSS